ncbi:DUF2309 domain-containing protein [Dechloromonas sp. ZY10]|uniref:DUF2309 domain-containing protein n=1 Tax=Dechloromonas aquae TaxID=2664436 RepID=UPI003528AA3E
MSIPSSSGAEALSFHERLAEWLHECTHRLPAQAPLRDFVHHNTLHAYQHLPFRDAVATAQAHTGALAYWPEARFRREFESGRITRSDLAAALVEAGIPDPERPVLPGLSRQDVLLAALCTGVPFEATGGAEWWLAEHRLETDPLFSICQQLTVAMPSTAAATGEVANWREQARQRQEALWAQLGDRLTWRGLIEHLYGLDLLAAVRTVLQRHLAAHLDHSLAAWRNPARGEGFYAAWRASAGLDWQWEFDELPNVRDEIRHLPDDPVALLAEELPRLLPEAQWPRYLERLLLEFPGWSGMLHWHQEHPEAGDGTPVALADWLAVRVLLERLLCEDQLRRLTGQPLACSDLADWFTARPGEFLVRDAWRCRALPEELAAEVAAALECSDQAHASVAWDALAERLAALPQAREDARALWRLCSALGLGAEALAAWSPAAAEQILDVAASLSAGQRGEIWLLAYEGHYREQLFAALRANHGRSRLAASRSAQVVMCMDDREEGTRRHLEEIAPEIETYGAAGFFGVAMYWQGQDDPAPTALCPVVVRPEVLIREQANADSAQQERHQSRQQRRLRWRERLHRATRLAPVSGPLLAAGAAVPALAALLAGSLAPAWLGERLQHWRRAYEGELPGELQLTAGPEGAKQSPRLGFTDREQIERVAAFLRMIGLTGGFAPLVLLLGHGSTSLNNPHRSAYDCGACSGRHGGPNARVFAAMANRPEVRAGLAEVGIQIPESTWFVAAFHNTCDDRVDWYDLDQVPAGWQGALDTLVGQLAAACRAHAVERCRRLASAPRQPSPWQAWRHVAGRAQDLSQARPELGHATNAAAYIGRRQASRGLFLDRRVFLISYDPLTDDGGRIVEGILLAAGPVGAGISLEYYFSTVDNERYGCGSKVTHNLAGGFGVMAGCESDLRTGLPQQMVEIHEPMRLLIVVEQTPAILDAIVARQPALQELIGNAWVTVAAQDPHSGEIQRLLIGRGWVPWQPAAEGEPPVRVADSASWFAGKSTALPPALLDCAVPPGGVA